MLIIASMFLFAFIGPMVRWIALPTEIVVFLYSLFAFLILLVYFLVNGVNRLKLDKSGWWVAASALALAVTSICYLKAYTLTTLANGVLTHYTAPIFALFFAVLLLKEKIEKLSIIAVAMSFIGLFIITYPELSFGNSHLIGIIWGTFSGLAYGILIIINKKIVHNNTKHKILFYQALIPMLIFLPFVFTLDYAYTVESILLSFLYAVLIFIVPGFLYLSGLKYVKAQHAGIVAYAEPIFVFIIGILLFAEVPSIRTLIGGVLILYSGYLVIRAESKRRAKF